MSGPRVRPVSSARGYLGSDQSRWKANQVMSLIKSLCIEDVISERGFDT